jgi:DNA polymerase-3 subunit gamma/tau
MSYQVLARKWRPQTFQEMVGQEHVTRTLANALERGRVHHAYLLTGPRGCGKTTMARLLAKALNCDEGLSSEPCGKCPSCEGIARGSFLDVLEIDAASNTGVDNIRELRESAQYQPSPGKKRVFIIDEVHMLSKGAFNALLKTLEEPPPHVHFVFATTEPVRIPRTITSRCQRFDFRLFRLEELAARLRAIAAAEKIQISSGAIELLASMAEGSMRDALSLFDQAVSATEGELDETQLQELYGLVGYDVYLRLNDLIFERDSAGVLNLIEELAHNGHDLVEFGRGIVSNFRDLLLLRVDDALASRVEKPEAVRARMRQQAQRFAVPDLLALTQRSGENYLQLERSPQPRWLLEAQLVDYAQHESQILLSELMARLDAMGAAGAAPMKASGGEGGGARPEKAPTPKAAPKRQAAARAEAATVAPVVAAPPEAASAPMQAINDSQLQAAYTRLLTQLREEDMGVGSCLLEATPRVEGDLLQLVFKSQHAFHRDQVGKKESLGRLLRIARECFGRAMKVEAISDEPSPDEEAARRAVQAKVAPTVHQVVSKLRREEPGLDRLLDGLGGEFVDGPATGGGEES